MHQNFKLSHLHTEHLYIYDTPNKLQEPMSPYMPRIIPYAKYSVCTSNLINWTAYISDIDECAPAPCQNGGVCTDGINAYTCACSAGYEGVNCENGK